MDLEQFANQLFERLPEGSVSVHPRREIQPVHVFYGGADLFTSGTPEKLARLARESLNAHAGDFVEFAKAMWIEGADALPDHPDALIEIAELLEQDPDVADRRYPGARNAKRIFELTIDKLATGPVEDLRIDFEDGYGFRSDDEEDAHAISASRELAQYFKSVEKPGPHFGFRIKSFGPETRRRSVRTLRLFLENLSEGLEGRLPGTFAVNLPKIRSAEEVWLLSEILDEFENRSGSGNRSLQIEVMIETPEAISRIDELAAAAPGRLSAAHFGAYDYTSALGIAASHQHLRHEACNFARSSMLNAFVPRDIWVADSVTVEMPVPVHRNADLSKRQAAENRRFVHSAWRKHFNNVSNSMINGFYQSWDLHPAQLPARYAAVFGFYLSGAKEQMNRLRSFIERASRASLTGNVFDDAASAEGLLNFFRRGCACGAFETGRIADDAGITVSELKSGSFKEIVSGRTG